MNTPTVATICADLDRLDELLRWAFHDGHWPENSHGRTARPRRSLSKDEQDKVDRDADYVPSKRKRDTGLGNDDRRAAYTEAVRKLNQAETVAARSLVHAWIRQPALVKPRAGNALSLIMMASRRLRIRVARLDDATALATVAQAIDTAIRHLDKAFTIGKSNAVAVEPPCRNHKRGCLDSAVPGRSRCWGCYRWWRDHKQEKPTAYLRENIEPAQEAQQRRHDRGEGWGYA